MVIISLVLFKVSKIVSPILHFGLVIFNNMAEIFARFPYATIFVKRPYTITVILYYFGIYLFLISIPFKPEKWKWIKIRIKLMIAKLKGKVIFLIILVIVLILFMNLNKGLNIYFIDVGQGDSTLVVTKSNKKILIDGGGSLNKESFDVGKNTLLPYLLNKRIKTLDYVMISHFDADHCNGLLAILENLKVRNLVISKQIEITKEYENIMGIVNRKKIKVAIVQAGDELNIDKDIVLKILYPDFKIAARDLNNNAIVAKLYYNDFSMLFTGDIEEVAEKHLVGADSISAQLQSTILKIPHHGSKTSSSKSFLGQVNPRIALIGVGENNTFRHPAPEVLERLEVIRL